MALRSTIDTAVRAIRAGQMVLVADDQNRENEGDLVIAAEHVDRNDMVFLLRHGSGIICAAMTNTIADNLALAPMVDTNTDNHGTAFTVSVDAVGTSTGISAEDRALTVRTLVSATARPYSLRRPGHIFPLRARDGGVLERDGHTEAAVDLMSLASCREVAVITELVDDDGVPVAGGALTRFADQHGIPMISIPELSEYRKQTQVLARLSEPADLPTDYGTFEVRSYPAVEDGVEHLVLTFGNFGDTASRARGVLTRIHSECLTGDLFRSRRCDCGAQLDIALKEIVAEGAGVLVYLRRQEGRGIGLAQKIAAYALQDVGCDTVDANLQLGLPIDNRSYDAAAKILDQLGVRHVRLITNNPDKTDAIMSYGISVVARVQLPTSITPDNLAYLRTKRDRMGHLLDLPTTPGDHATPPAAASRQ